MDRIQSLEMEVSDLRRTLHVKEKELYSLKIQWSSSNQKPHHITVLPSNQYEYVNGKLQYERLPKWAIERYSRQILLPDIGVAGQEKLCAAKVLIVGAGGLGCPAAMYLAGAGIGEIGIVDYDSVDLTNIHRQILHGEADQHMNKVDSAADTLRGINSKITITPYNVQLDAANAIEIASKYDVVLDCTDNVPTRYMLNDVCVITKIPLVSGSALKMDGQITIYGYRGEKNPDPEEASFVGPCYRCVFPEPPPAEAVGSCSSNGVAGPVPGVIGALQALETIKYIVGQPRNKLLVGRMVLFDGEIMSFRTIKLRGQNPECAACSKTPSITQLECYETFCRAKAKEKRREEARRKLERRDEEKKRRMSGQSYLGFRCTRARNNGRTWVQDVPKEGRRMGPPCKSEYCAKGANRCCTKFNEEERQEMFKHFWNDLDWGGKKKLVRSLIDIVPPKRRRGKHKGETSRKGDSKVYHLRYKDEKKPVCRIMFLNTLGVKEAMVRSWLFKEKVPRKSRTPLKALDVHSYIDNLPKSPPKCEHCQKSSDIQYINLDNVKNLYQLYNLYVKEMKDKGENPASRKTFTKVFCAKEIRIFKAKNDDDVCDVVAEHNELSSVDDDECNVVTQNELSSVENDESNLVASHNEFSSVENYVVVPYNEFSSVENDESDVVAPHNEFSSIENDESDVVAPHNEFSSVENDESVVVTQNEFSSVENYVVVPHNEFSSVENDESDVVAPYNEFSSVENDESDVVAPYNEFSSVENDESDVVAPHNEFSSVENDESDVVAPHNEFISVGCQTSDDEEEKTENHELLQNVDVGVMTVNYYYEDVQW